MGILQYECSLAEDSKNEQRKNMTVMINPGSQYNEIFRHVLSLWVRTESDMVVRFYFWERTVLLTRFSSYTCRSGGCRPYCAFYQLTKAYKYVSCSFFYYSLPPLLLCLIHCRMLFYIINPIQISQFSSCQTLRCPYGLAFPQQMSHCFF